MNLYLGSIAKAIAIVIAMLLSKGVVDDTQVDSITGYVLLALTGAYEWWETRRLAKQGTVSTNPTTNLADPRSEEKLIAEEAKT
jgi:hypothetical protein